MTSVCPGAGAVRDHRLGEAEVVPPAPDAGSVGPGAVLRLVEPACVHLPRRKTETDLLKPVAVEVGGDGIGLHVFDDDILRARQAAGAGAGSAVQSGCRSGRATSGRGTA